MAKTVLVAVDVRSAHNVGSFFRTCDGLGVDHLYLTGISPHPVKTENDTRLPHIAQKAQKDIHKTALGAEVTFPHSYYDDTILLLEDLRKEGWYLCALEQDVHSHNLTEFKRRGKKVALIVGNEVDGLSKEVLERCDEILEIAMVGQKESFNVSVAAAIGLFWLINH